MHDGAAVVPAGCLFKKDPGRFCTRWRDASGPGLASRARIAHLRARGCTLPCSIAGHWTTDDANQPTTYTFDATGPSPRRRRHN